MKKKASSKTKETKVDNSKTVSYCNFYGVKWEESAVNAVQTIAEGLVENAKGLGKLAEVLKASNVTINSLLKVTNDDIVVEKD